MRVLLLLTMLCSCSITSAPDSIISSAELYRGLHETTDRRVLRELTGIDPVNTQWCAAYVNSILALNDISGTDSLMARSFLQWGDSVLPKDIAVGDIVVFPRDRDRISGHVGFYTGTIITDTGLVTWRILGGNYNNTVAYGYFSPSSAIGIRRSLL